MATPIDSTKRKKRWSLRLLALLVGCLPILLIEGLLRVAGLPPEAPAIDPLVDLHHLRPLFEISQDGQRYFIPAERLNLFREASFARQKPQNTFRVFALGESTTQGEPYSTPTAFPAWMGIDLEAASQQKIEVINCGGLSYASYRIKAILEEVLNYSPDLIVLYVGQNEFLESRSYDGWRDVPLPLAQARSWLDASRIVQTTRWIVGGTARRGESKGMRTELSREVDALLDYRGGLEAYHRDDPWREPVVAHFQWNLMQMAQMCKRHGVPLILMRPVVNLLDCPPMKFETKSSLPPDRRQIFETAWQDAQTHATDPAVARQHLDVAYAIDPEHAGVNFFLGRLEFEAGHWDKARSLLIAAKDNDVCPLRALTSIQEAVTRVAQECDVALLDAERLFADQSPHGLVGNKWLVDHVHPNIEGHQLLGEATAQLILDRGWLPVRDSNWRDTRMLARREHLQRLGEDYFQRGKQRLEGLLLWTQGRAKKVR